MDLRPPVAGLVLALLVRSVFAGGGDLIQAQALQAPVKASESCAVTRPNGDQAGASCKPLFGGTRA